MAGVENLFIHWPRRHNLGPEWQLQEIYWLGKPPGCISPGIWTGCLDGSVYLIQEYNQTLKSNIQIPQIQIMKELFFVPSWSYHALQLFPTNQLHFISSLYFSIRYLNDSGRICIYYSPSNSLAKDILYCNHVATSFYLCVRTKHMQSLLGTYLRPFNVLSRTIIK